MVPEDSVLTSRKIALQVQGVVLPTVVVVHLHVDEHIAGNRYRQIYKVRPVNNDAASVGLVPTLTYCLRVYHIPFCRFCPPDSFLYTTVPRRRMSSVLPQLSRTGALWQLLIRAAASWTLGWEEAVANVYATFCDQNLLAFGYLTEWTGGRMWRLEMDDRMREREIPPHDVDYREPSQFRSEFTAKRFFLARMEKLMREMGADGLARRYSWSNLLSACRVELRSEATDPYRGLVAVDFEPALGNPQRLQKFLDDNADRFVPFQLAAQELLQYLATLADPRTPASPSNLPRRNPAVAHLIWEWSSPVPRPTFWERVRKKWAFYRRKLHSASVLARKPELRTSWLFELVENGLREGQLSPEEAEKIRRQASDPHVQLYLHCLFVHVCMLPVTPLTVTLTGGIYAALHNLTWLQGIQFVAAWLAVFAVVPVSPGSIVRGLYVLWVALRRKLVRELRIALIVSFWRYVGYLAFPLQLAATFPALSRFMAARWATEVVRKIPYYGTAGGRLEHMVFDLFFNWPLTLARERRERNLTKASKGS